MHKEDIINIWTMEWPQRKPTRGFNPICVKFSPFGKKQNAKEPATICPIYYSRVQNMTASVTQSSCYKIRSLRAVSLFIQQDGSHVEI